MICYDLGIGFGDSSGKSVNRLEDSVGIHMDIYALGFWVCDATECSLDKFSEDNNFGCISSGENFSKD